MRIATIGRSLGLHLVLATQRPQDYYFAGYSRQYCHEHLLRVASAQDYTTAEAWSAAYISAASGCRVCAPAGWPFPTVPRPAGGCGPFKVRCRPVQVLSLEGAAGELTAASAIQKGAQMRMSC